MSLFGFVWIKGLATSTSSVNHSHNWITFSVIVWIFKAGRAANTNGKQHCGSVENIAAFLWFITGSNHRNNLIILGKRKGFSTQNRQTDKQTNRHGLSSDQQGRKRLTNEKTGSHQIHLKSCKCIKNVLKGKIIQYNYLMSCSLMVFYAWHDIPVEVCLFWPLLFVVLIFASI